MSNLTLKQAEELAKTKEVAVRRVEKRKTFIGSMPHTGRAFYYLSVHDSGDSFFISKKTALYLSETYNLPIR